MIDRIRALFTAIGEPGIPGATAPRDRSLAAAVLMVEAAAQDGTVDNQEREAIAAIVQRHFGLDAGEAATLLAEAEQAQNEANHLLRFTRTVKDGWPLEERARVIEMLWEVAYADGILHDYEANLLRRVSGLLYVSDRESAAARKRAMVRLGIP